MTRPTRRGTKRNARVRCAIYTRKSSEEGLEQEFNSLLAQREACEAFITSQVHEGWVCLGAGYDDGGFSGATMGRPALQRLLADITAGRIDIVVVYKIDRLTRSLTDFAKIVEILDARGASFVSVTQQFNTTTSMGRLTLNVLLSFAQFEREVIGERIRDKIAASKRKGMWMGGVPPLGYRVQDRKLVIVDSEAEIVRSIFRRYAELGSVRLLKAELDAQGRKSKSWTSASGRLIGGKPFSRGALYLMLRNRTYRGEIIHKGQSHPSEHPPIIDQPLWDAVQAQLADNSSGHNSGTRTHQSSLLAGMLFDAEGNRMTPSYAVKKSTRYHYYVSRPLITQDQTERSAGLRIPAGEIEPLVTSRMRQWLLDSGSIYQATQLSDPSTQRRLIARAAEIGKSWTELPGTRQRAVLTRLIDRIDVGAHQIDIHVRPTRLAALLDVAATPLPSATDDEIQILSQIELAGDQTDISELKALAPLCNCEITTDTDGRASLSGSSFNDLSSVEEVRQKAIGILALLNGIARISSVQFQPVQFRGVSRTRPDGMRDVFVDVSPMVARGRFFAPAIVLRGDGTVEPAIPDPRTQRAKRIIADPKLCEIVKAIAGDITLQRLRVVFEMICALVSGRTAKRTWDNALVKNGYATQDEITRFKENVQDPRLSGLDAVHGVPRGPPRATKMTEQEAIEFVRRLLNTYLDRQPQ